MKIICNTGLTYPMKNVDGTINLENECPAIKFRNIYVKEISNIPNDITIVGYKYKYGNKKLKISFTKESPTKNITLKDFCGLSQLDIFVRDFHEILNFKLIDSDIKHIMFHAHRDENGNFFLETTSCRMRIKNCHVEKITTDRGLYIKNDRRDVYIKS